MPIGPGKYDDLCTKVREEAEAVAAIVVVFRGNLGTGFSIQSESEEVVNRLPSILRAMAAEMEQPEEEYSVS